MEDEPHVPLTDDWYAHRDKFVLRYGDPGTDGLLREILGKQCVGIGGYDIREAWERASVAGLAVQPISYTSLAGVSMATAG